MSASTQGLLAGVHYGVGQATGALTGGFLFDKMGARAAFLSADFMAGLALVLLVGAHLWLKRRAQFMLVAQQEEETAVVQRGGLTREEKRAVLEIGIRNVNYNSDEEEEEGDGEGEGDGKQGEGNGQRKTIKRSAESRGGLHDDDDDDDDDDDIFNDDAQLISY